MGCNGFYRGKFFEGALRGCLQGRESPRFGENGPLCVCPIIANHPRLTQGSPGPEAVRKEQRREEKNVHNHHRKKIIRGTFLASKKNSPGRWKEIRQMKSVRRLLLNSSLIPHSWWLDFLYPTELRGPRIRRRSCLVRGFRVGREEREEGHARSMILVPPGAPETLQVTLK